MTRACPSDSRLIEYVDEALPRESMTLVEQHLRECSRCRREAGALAELGEDLGQAPVAALDVDAHVRDVMARLDQPLPEPRSRLVWISSVASLAAAVTLAVGLGVGGSRGPVLQARGGALGSSLERDVGVRPFAHQSDMRWLQEGLRFDAEPVLGATVSNLGAEPAYLLLFAVDAKESVHWISPPFADPREDPAATQIDPHTAERALKSEVELEDASPGALRIITLLTREPRHVSDIEKLRGAELELSALRRRFGTSAVRQTTIVLTDEARNP